MNVKNVAERLGVSEYTIRYYTNEDLIPHLKRDKNNSRVFDEESIKWLEMIILLRTCGMSINAIREYIDLCLIGNETAQQRKNIVVEQKQKIDSKLAELQSCSERLEKKIELYDEIIQNHRKDITEKL